MKEIHAMYSVQPDKNSPEIQRVVMMGFWMDRDFFLAYRTALKRRTKLSVIMRMYAM